MGAVRSLAVITAAVMLGGLIGVFVLGNHGGNPPSLVRADDPVVKRARFTRVFELDGGALRVDPPSGSPKVTESQAIATFRTVSLPSFDVSDVVIGFGLVTLRADLTPNEQPVLSRQPSWVVTYYFAGRVPCLAITSVPAHPAPPGRPAFILDATTGIHLIHYLSRGSYCAGPPTGPQARTANIGLLFVRSTYPPGPPWFEYFDGRVRIIR